MVFEGEISPEVRAYVRYLRNEMHLSYRAIAKKCHIAHTSVGNILHSPLHPPKKTSSTRPGRPRKLTPRRERHLLRELNKMQEEQGKFSVADVMTQANVSSSESSERSVRRLFNRNGYSYLPTRRKGILTKQDLKLRVTFARRTRKKYPANFWTHDVAFYLDGVSFAFKTKPYEQAKAPGARIWRKKGQGLQRCCTCKGSKEGTGGHYVRLIVAISYKKGIIKCEPYEKMSGQYFANFIRDNFDEMFDDAAKDSTTWVQDNDPSQNSALAREAMKYVRCNLLSIPARSPDMNPIENIFHLANNKLCKDAIAKRIEKETFEQFQERVIQTLYEIPSATIDKTIASMDSRLRMIVQNGGIRLKY